MGRPKGFRGKATYVKLPDEQRERVEQIAADELLGMSDIIRRAVDKYLAEYAPQRKPRRTAPHRS